MQFGYFTLSDNHYADNRRAPNQFVADILDEAAITPQPVQRPIPAYVASFSQPSIELAARLGCNLVVAPFAAAMTYGGLKQVADVYHECCAKVGTRPGRLMCSY